MPENCPIASRLLESDKNCHFKQEFFNTIGNLCDSNITDNPEICGSVVAYDVLRIVFNDLSELDIDKPIKGECEIQGLPRGISYANGRQRIFEGFPDELLQEWTGIKVPVRNDEAFYDGTLELDSRDVLLSLLVHGRFNAALWIFKNTAIDSSKQATWKLDVYCTDGSKDVEACYSSNYYLKNLPIELVDYLDKKYSGFDAKLPFDEDDVEADSDSIDPESPFGL